MKKNLCCPVAYGKTKNGELAFIMPCIPSNFFCSFQKNNNKRTEKVIREFSDPFFANAFFSEYPGFTLTQGGGFQPFPPESYKYSLSVSKRKLECEITRASTDIRHIEVNFDNAHWQEVWKKIQQCNFLAWQENYDIFACDAGEWDLTVRLKGGKKFHVRGTILYPEEWDMLLKLIHDLLNPFSTMGSGSFSVKNIPHK